MRLGLGLFYRRRNRSIAVLRGRYSSGVLRRSSGVVRGRYFFRFAGIYFSLFWKEECDGLVVFAIYHNVQGLAVCTVYDKPPVRLLSLSPCRFALSVATNHSTIDTQQQVHVQVAFFFGQFVKNNISFSVSPGFESGREFWSLPDSNPGPRTGRPILSDHSAVIIGSLCIYGR